MSAFELVFALFGLLLGLAIAEVLGGFARVLKLKRSERAKVRIGWLTPLLGLFVVLDQTQFWLVAYNIRDLLSADYATLLAVLAIVGAYYLASTLIFPEDPEEWPDFDLHYDKHNRLVLGAMLATHCAILVLAVAVAAGAAPNGEPLAAETGAEDSAGLAALVGTILPFALLIALIVVKSRAANIAFLVALIAINLAYAVGAFG